MLDLALKKQRKEMLLHGQQIVRNWLKCAVSILHLHVCCMYLFGGKGLCYVHYCYGATVIVSAGCPQLYLSLLSDDASVSVECLDVCLVDIKAWL